MAIQGPGFFQIVQPDGTISYTRDGGFKLSQEGELVTPSGLLLQPQIVIPPEAASITIGADGIVSAELANGGGNQQLGQIQLARFINGAGLEAQGENLFRETTSSGAPLVLFLVSRGLAKFSGHAGGIQR